MYALFGLSRGNVVATPGTVAESRNPDDEPGDAETASLARKGAGIALYISQRRSDIQFAAKESARGMAAPTHQDLGRAKRIARYLRGTEDIALKLEPNAETEEELHGYADSDWAADRVKRKSTTGCAIQWCGCTLYDEIKYPGRSGH